MWRLRGVKGAELAVCCAALLWCGGCGVIQKKPESRVDEMALVGRQIPPEQAEEVLGELGSSFIYGPTLGETAVNVGTAIAFPPYALYLVGNAILSLSGYQPVTVSTLLPDEAGRQWSETVDELYSGPGRVVAAVAGREARSREVTEMKVREILERLPPSTTEEVKTALPPTVNQTAF
jgi:hypothetical protein